MNTSSWIGCAVAIVMLGGCGNAGGGTPGADAGESATEALRAMCRNVCGYTVREVCIASSEAECAAACPDEIAAVEARSCGTQYAAYAGCVFGATSGELCPGMSLASGSCGAALAAYAGCVSP